MATKNPFGKSRKPATAYVKLEMHGWTWHVLKLYQAPRKAITDQYARAFCFVTSPICPDGEYGDVYVREIPGLSQWLAAEAHKLEQVNNG